MRSDTLIRHEGMKALRECLGLVEAEKFITLLRREPFDYTEWRKVLWEGKTIEDLFLAAKEFENHSIGS
jgi:hypothetical protein